ncbi:hypothetical protein LIER_02731 [Lithospermum erythrorhizon]|uniref:Uncharacterized protein n=1 Tax=Lithospermum erythrorhizon TaxID=34254 RepID=A0AAV3NT47_LITER
MVTFETSMGREFSTLRIVGSETTRKVLHLKGSGEESSDLPHGFHFLGTMISSDHVQWKGPLKIRGNFDYVPGYHYLAAQSLDERVSTSAWIGFSNHSLRSYVSYEAAERSTSKTVYPLTWKTTRPDRAQPLFYDDHAKQFPLDRDLFVSLRTGRVCHRVGSEFMVEPHNPYRFSRQFGYAPTIPGVNNNTREMVDLSTGLEFWHTGILSRARQTVTFPCSTSPHTPHASYRTWLSKLFPSEAPRSSSVKHGKGKSFPAGVHPSTLVFQPYGSSKRKRSSSSTVENRDPKHARGVRKDTSSSSGSRVASLVCRSPERFTPSVIPDSVIRDHVVEVSSSVSSQKHTEFVDTGESTKCFAIEVAESCPPSLPALTIAQGARATLHTGASSLWACICDGL